MNRTKQTQTWIKFKVLSTMKQTKTKVTIAFDRHSHQVCFAHCTCPSGLSSTCIHVCASLWSMEAFGSQLAPTSKPCTWIRPKSKCKATAPVSGTALKKHSIFKQESQSSETAHGFGSRPPSVRGGESNT
jgi:hypothetical protein